MGRGFARRDDGGGGGTANVGALLRQAGETNQGLFISHRSATVKWHLRGVERVVEEAAAGAIAQFTGADSNNYLTLAFNDPTDTPQLRFAPLVGSERRDQPEAVNTYAFHYTEFPAPTAEVKAKYEYGDLRITSRQSEGAAGNDDRVQVAIGQAATSDRNAEADIPLYNGTPGVLRAGQIRVTSPDRAQGGNYAAPPSYFILDRFSFRATERGTAGNALEFQIRSVVDADQTEAETWTAAYTDDTTLRVTVTFNSGVATERRTFTSSLFVAAFNAATDSNGNRPITLIDGFPSHPDSVNWRLATGTNAPFSGGTDVSGGGTPTNFGGIELVSSGPRSAAVQASVTWGNVVLTARTAGTFPNNGKYQVQVVGTNSGGHQYRVTRSDLTGGRHFQVLIDSSVGSAPTVAQVIRGLNDADTENLITASAAAGVSDTSVAWTGTGTLSFTGGADAVNPLAASWDADSHTLTITALDSDPASEVITAITALDEFGTSVGPGYVRLAGGGLTTGVINVDDTVGNTLSYAFAGGTDGAARTPLAVANRNDPDGDGNLLAITGLINGDTTQDVIDAYSGNRFTLTSVASDATTAFSNPVALAPTSLTGGLDAAVRQTPTVHVESDAGGTIAYRINYHGPNTPSNQRTTLAEFKTAWESIAEVDGLHGNDVVGVITGSAADRIGAVPDNPTGGEDYVAASGTEALVRPEDEEHGPNIEVRYDATDTLEDIALALLNQGLVSVIETYETDLTAHPEAVGFSRSMFAGGGEAEAVAGEGITVQDEGTALTTLGNTLDFTGAGVQASGTGATKTINIPGSDFDLHDDVTTEATELNANANDRFVISQEAETGDPMVYITAGNVRKYMKGYVGPWADTPGGFVFRKGDITDHSGQWYITSTQHSKRANGPDTDPTRFAAITHWGGAWTAKYYHVGTFTTHANGLWVNTQGVADTDPAPDHADNTKWVRIDGSGSGGTTVEANPSGSADGGDLTKIQIGDTVYDIPTGGGSTGEGSGLTEVYDSGSFVQIVADTWIEAAVSEAFTDNDQLILLVQRQFGVGSSASIAQAPVSSPWSLIAESDLTTHSGNSQQTGTQLVFENLGTVTSDQETALVLRKRTDGSVGYLLKDAMTSARVRIYKVPLGGGAGEDGTQVEANPSGAVDSGALTKLDVDGNIYSVGGGGGPFATEMGRFSLNTVSANRVYDTGLDIPDSVPDGEWWGVQVLGGTDDPLHLFPAATVIGATNLEPGDGRFPGGVTTFRGYDGVLFEAFAASNDQTCLLGRTVGGDIVFATVSTTTIVNPLILYRINSGGDSAEGGGADLSDSDPLKDGTAAPGTSDEASRSDHVHPQELGDDVITPAMLDADSAEDKAALRTRIGAVSARANPSEAVDGGELTKVDIDGTIYEVPEGTFDLSDKVGATLTGLDGTATQGPAITDLNPVIWLSFSYTRVSNTNLRFNTMVRKADFAGLAAGSAYRLQGQGAGGDYFNLWETNGNLTISVSNTASYPLVALDIYNVKGATGGSGGGADLSLANPEPLGTAAPGTGTEASRSDHVHPTELVDDVITPAMLVADSAGEKTAMRTRIGAGTSSLTTGNVDARINPIARVGNTDRWPTNKLNTDVVLTAELTAAVAGFLSQNQVDARVTALVNALALASNTSRWGKTKLPSDTVYDADIANFRTATQITTQINAALAGFSHWEDNWDAGTAYTTGRVVRHNSAAYIALQAVGANTSAQTEPGVGSAWATNWFRLGYANGAPNSLVTPTFDSNNGQLVLTDRSGTAHRVTIPSGGTAVVANPSGSDGDDLDRLSVGGANFNIPHFRPIQIGHADFGNTSTAHRYRAHASGGGIDKPANIASGEWWAITTSDPLYGPSLRIFPADSVPTGPSVGQDPAANGVGGARIPLSQTRAIYLAWTNAGKMIVGGDNASDNVNELTLFRMGLGDDPAADPGNLRPSIASFVSTSGDLSPAAGSIASDVYGASWAISQSDHIGSARIIGFKGSFNSSNVAVLHSITAGNYAHGATTFAIPAGINLAADETYTLRLQVFGEGITNPGNATQPAAYHDIVVTAHAPATANYQWGVFEQVDGETAAQSAARIAGWTNWQDSDTTDGGMTTETDGTLNTSTGYSAFAPDVSDSAGTNLFQFFLAVKSGETKPTGWTGNGLDASGAFYAGVDETVGTTTYTFYILKSFLSRNHADGDIRYVPRTS